MSERKVVNENELARGLPLRASAFVAIGLILVSPSAFAKKTVGEVLQAIEDQKKTVALPQVSTPQAAPAGRVNLQAIKPPSRSTLYYEEGTNEADLERVTDQGINQLYKLTQQFRTSKRRGELWLRLAELYVEKSRLIEFHAQSKYDQQLKVFQAKQTTVKPKINLKPAQEYNRKAIQLYEWFLRDFPQDPKVDQALFFLGYNYFELGDYEKGKQYYEKLSTQYPDSPYVDESNFALGEFYFENERWKNGLEYYDRVSKNRRGRLYSFALYKSAWCHYKLNETVKALGNLELVIRAGKGTRADDEVTGSGANRIRLATEAIRDLVIFYAEAGNYKRARSYFEKVAGEKNAFALTEKLAYYYVDTGNKEGARYIFTELIDEKPNAPKAFDYQYQIVLMYGATGDNPVFRKELYLWMQNYGSESSWAKANSGNNELIQKTQQLMETSLRNHILQEHQTAQNSHSPQAQKLAREGYNLYFDTFSSSKHIDEMHFFFGELLYDMKDYENAATQYLWVVDHGSKGKYYEKSIVNAILALEKRLPKPEEVKKIVGDSVEPVEFTDVIKNFEKTALKYFQTAKKTEDSVAIKYRLASLYYYFNQFDNAIPLFKEIIQEQPKSQYAEYSANLLLDTYNLKKDFVGLEIAAQDILKVPALKNSKVGDQIRSILQRTSFKKAQELEKSSDYLKSAQTYEEFAQKNSNSELGGSAYYNAGVNYEKGGDLDKAAQNYSVVVTSRASIPADLRRNASKFLAALYEKTGQYAKAAESFERYASENPKDKESADFYFNAAVIRDGMNNHTVALKNYQKYFDTSKKRDRSEAIFLMAKINERRKNYKQAISYYKQFIEANPKNAGELIEAHFSLAQLYEKMGNHKSSEEYYGKTIAVQRKLADKNENVGASFAAESRFKQVRKTYETLRSIRIPAGPKQAQAVQEKLSYLNRLKEELKSVIKYDDGYQIVAALSTMGQAYQHMAASLYNAPVPKGLDAGGLKTYREGIDKIAKPFAEEAKNNYQLAIDKGQKLETYNEFMKVAMHELGAIDTGKYRDYNERAILTKLPDSMEPSSSDQKAVDEASKQSEGPYLQAVAKVLGHDQNDVYTLNSLALHSFSQEKYGLAKIILNRALKEHADFPALHNNLGIVYLAEGNLRKAIPAFKKALDLKNSYRIGSTNLASIYLEYRDYSKAIVPLEASYKAMKSDLRKGTQDAIGVANNYALALSGEGEHKKAKDIYKEILDKNTRNTTVLLNYAILLIEKLKDKGEGKSILNKLKFAASEPALERQADELGEKLKGLQE